MKYGIPPCNDKIPIYPRFYLLEEDYPSKGSLPAFSLRLARSAASATAAMAPVVSLHDFGVDALIRAGCKRLRRAEVQRLPTTLALG